MKELKKVTAMLGTMLTPEEIEEFMAEADKEYFIVREDFLSINCSQDGNGKLDYDEFVKMLLQY